MVVSEGTISGTFKLKVKYSFLDRGETREYTEEYDNLSTDANSSRYFVNVVNEKSMIVSVEDLGGDAGVATGTYTLSGGVDPDYSSGFDKLKLQDDIHIVITDRTSSVIRNLLISHCEEMGDRVCVLSPEPYMSVAEVKAIGDALDTDRGILTYPWVVAYDPVFKDVRSFPPSWFYAGVLSRIDPYLSPSNEKIINAIDVERRLTRADLVSLQDSKISPIYFWGVRGIRIRNGRNLSTDPNLWMIYRRRMADFIQEAVEDNFGWAVSKPHTSELRAAVAASLTKFFRDLQSRGWIEGFYVKCDETNNPPEVREAHRLVVDYGVRLYPAADYIHFRSLIGETVETEVK